MNKVLLAGGCSFTFGNELSDDTGKTYSTKTWSSLLSQSIDANYFCVAKGGSGNCSIARRVFNYVSNHNDQNMIVCVMWSFPSRYDWAMPRHKLLENSRWTTITPWDTSMRDEEIARTIGGSEPVIQIWKTRQKELIDSGVRPFADALYKHAANQYHEIYLSWKSIIWLQNILEKKDIPYFFTLADNSLFYDELLEHKDQDGLMSAMYKEINFDNWFFFGERKMGFNQWSLLEDYPRATTHPLDKAHKDATGLMKDKFLTIYKGE